MFPAALGCAQHHTSPRRGVAAVPQCGSRCSNSACRPPPQVVQQDARRGRGSPPAAVMGRGDAIEGTCRATQRGPRAEGPRFQSGGSPDGRPVPATPLTPLDPEGVDLHEAAPRRAGRASAEQAAARHRAALASGRGLGSSGLQKEAPPPPTTQRGRPTCAPLFSGCT